MLLSSLLSYEDLSPLGSGEGADPKEKAITWGTGTTLVCKNSPSPLLLPSTPTCTPGTHSG